MTKGLKPHTKGVGNHSEGICRGIIFLWLNPNLKGIRGEIPELVGNSRIFGTIPKKL